MIEDLSIVLRELGFTFFTLYDRIDKDKRGFTTTGHYIFISGKGNLSRWMHLISFHNPKHFTKYLVWKRFGWCPPFTTLAQMRELLNGPGGNSATADFAFLPNGAIEPPTPTLGE